MKESGDKTLRNPKEKPDRIRIEKGSRHKLREPKRRDKIRIILFFL